MLVSNCKAVPALAANGVMLSVIKSKSPLGDAFAKFTAEKLKLPVLILFFMAKSNILLLVMLLTCNVAASKFTYRSIPSTVSAFCFWIVMSKFWPRQADWVLGVATK
ncbi:hypothetical protein BGP_5655 [Beggiatoa sp. PS]|nr:hypothetical protein BGP_5655 [Beggiatoa sp. PS]